MGGRIAGAGPDLIKMLDEFGKCVGLAFQIADDVLDIIGDPTKMGKGVQKDAEHGKLTYPGLLGLEESRRRAEQLIDDACRAIAPLGDRGQRLEALARFVLERDH
jgi:geranylgeranyl diphosphate synthase type II